MSDIAHFFKQLNFSEIAPAVGYNENQFGSICSINWEGNEFPELDGVELALIGVREDRSSNENAGTSGAPDIVRSYFHQLYPGPFATKMVDLGNIQKGHEISDTYYALAETIDYLLRKNIVPIIVGGSHDLTFAQFKGYEKLEQTINVVNIDSVFDLGTPDDELHNKSHLGKMILYQPNYLFNFSNIGYQSYLVNPSSISMMQKLYFDTYRLGEIRNNIQESEPIIRHADMVSFDISAIKNADAPGTATTSPNGFYAEEACQMMRYAGMNDKLTSVGIYEINPDLDFHGKTSHLAAQMIWCFIDGFYNRKRDFPTRTSSDYTRYHVFLHENKYEINFYKSNKSDRWWMEVPYPGNKNLKFERHTLIPCSYKDYEIACKDEVPDRWWQTHQKLS